MSDHIARMKAEHSDLQDKILALVTFIHSNPVFKTLDEAEQSRMIKQCGFMESYLQMLASRIWSAK
jgi:hypothetical protein